MKRIALAFALFTGLALGCELLVKLDYEPHPDPAQDGAKYKPGDAVVVHEDGQPWGKREKLQPGQIETRPLFWIVKIPGVEAQTFGEYLLPIMSETNSVGYRSIVRRRQWQITTNTLPADWLQKLSKTGELVVRGSPVLDVPVFDCEWSDFRTNIINHATGQRETRRIVGILRQSRLSD